MLKKLMKKEEGFTLAELLIVVAIIAVLVAISIPIFTSQLEKSRESTDQANVRSAYAALVADYLDPNNSTSTMTVEARQTVTGWQGPSGTITLITNTGESEYTYDAKISGNSYTLTLTSDASGNASLAIS